MEKNPKTTKNIVIISIVIFIVFCLGIIAYVIFQNISNLGKIKIDIKYAPFIAEVKLNDKKIKNGEFNYLEPGSYTIEVSLENFETFTDTITIDESTEYLYGALEPLNEAGIATTKRYNQDFLAIQGYASQDSINEGLAEDEKWPILEKLPVSNALFSLGYKKTGSDIVLTIKASSSYLDSAIEKLISLNPSTKPLADYNIEIEDFQNPFTNQFVASSSSDPTEFLKNGFSNVECNVSPNGKTQGNYYLTNITTGSEDNYTLVTFHVVLIKTDNTWKLAGTPYPILTTTNTPNVPTEVLTQANNL